MQKSIGERRDRHEPDRGDASASKDRRNQDDHGAKQAKTHTNDIPTIWRLPFDDPKPGHGRADVDPAIGRISGASR